MVAFVAVGSDIISSTGGGSSSTGVMRFTSSIIHKNAPDALPLAAINMLLCSNFTQASVAGDEDEDCGSCLQCAGHATCTVIIVRG